MEKLLLYCTKAKPYLNCDFGKDNHEEYSGDWNIYLANKQDECSNIVNGKIVAECDFEVEKFKVLSKTIDGYKEFERKDVNYVLERSCLSYTELVDYLGENKDGYAIHIKNLHIFDKPRDIRNYYNIAPRTMQDCMNQRALVKAPQNMCNAYDVYKNHYILISIQPQWMCLILNRIKDVEVRKVVLKEMLKNE